MKVSELVAKQGNVDIEVEITEVSEAREFQKFGRPGRVATAVAKDDSGEINLTLWNEQIDAVKSGDKVKITNGYVSEWQGEKQLTTGKLGKLEIVGKGEAPAKPKKEKAPEPEKKSEVKEEKVEEEDLY